jgi:hypothetical protein
VFQRKWQSLPQYQQTRGTLGMLAQWLSRLYASQHQQAQAAPLITLGSAPLQDRSFRATILGQLGEPRLNTAIEADLAADTAHARALDADTQGALADIHRQVGTAILFECSGGQTDRAAHLPELRFALGGPQVDTTSIDTAAAALETRAFFVRQVGSDGYRIGPKPKLTPVVAETRASLDELRDVLPEARRLIEREFEAGSPVPVIAFPGDGASVRDTPRLSLLIADPTLEWYGSADLRDFLAEWTYRRGKESRLFPASLIWCLRQPGRVLLDRVETALAWRAVRQDLAAGLLGIDTDPQEARGIDASIRTAEQDAKDAVWADYRYLVFADPQEPSRMRVIDLGAGHSSSRETLAGRALAALKSQGLLNQQIGAGYVDRKWPPALLHTGAWPLSGLRQSFLDGSLTRLLDPDHLLRSRIVEWVDTGEFGLASGAQPDGGYCRIWFNQLVAPAEVTFDADVYLLKQATAVALQAPPDAGHASSVEPARDPAPVPLQPIGPPAARATSETTRSGPARITIHGDVPPEQWNRLGTKLLPRLRAAGRVAASITLCCEIETAATTELTAELERTLQDLGLADRLQIVHD